MDKLCKACVLWLLEFREEWGTWTVCVHWAFLSSTIRRATANCIQYGPCGHWLSSTWSNVRDRSNSQVGRWQNSWSKPSLTVRPILCLASLTRLLALSFSFAAYFPSSSFPLMIEGNVSAFLQWWSLPSPELLPDLSAWQSAPEALVCCWPVCFTKDSCRASWKFWTSLLDVNNSLHVC